MSDGGHSRSRRRGVAQADVVVVGLTIRALAQSAQRAGHRAVSVDRHGDRDHRRTVPNLSLRRDGEGGPADSRRLVALAERVEAASVAYGADLENHPLRLARLARGRRLLGNPPEVLAAVRDPKRLGAFLATSGLGLPMPPSLAPGRRPAGDGGTGWLRKPVRGGGGRGVRRWRPGEPVGPDAYLQRAVEGRPVGLMLVGDGRSAELLGAAEMIVGDPAFGAREHLYVGAVETTLARDLCTRAESLATALAGRFGLRGLFGIDLMAGRHRAWTLEVNPRVTASMELLERRAPGRLFRLHRAASLGPLGSSVDVARAPGPSVPSAGAPRDVGRARAGKAVVRARRTCRSPDLTTLDGVALADVPDRGQRFEAGDPVCTVFAGGEDGAACRAALRAAAGRVYRALEAPAGEPRARARGAAARAASPGAPDAGGD